MSKIHIIPSEFNKELELQLAYSIKAGFPFPAEDCLNILVGLVVPFDQLFLVVEGLWVDSTVQRDVSSLSVDDNIEFKWCQTVLLADL